eukprot:3642211-Rhodomonas_salina.8
MSGSDMGPENAMARKHDGSQTCTARSAAEPGRRTPGVSTRRSLTKARTMKEVERWREAQLALIARQLCGELHIAVARSEPVVMIDLRPDSSIQDA